MCGRFALRSSAPEVARILGLADEALALEARYNIAPSQPVAVCRTDSHGERRMTWMRWGLIPHWAKDERIGYRMINARAETVADKPAFAPYVRRRRCLIPADGYYEWRQLGPRKQPHFFHLHGHEPFCFAGLWARWYRSDSEPVESCTIITTAPNALCAEFHDRMPVILATSAYHRWLDPASQAAEQILDVLTAYPAERMSCFPVGTLVNSPRNDEARCVTPLGGEATGDLFGAG